MKDRTKRKKENREKSGCEGKSRIFRERIGRIPRLVICGGGHVSAAATKLGKMLGFEVTVLEDRPKFADHVRKAGADNVICAPFKEGLAKIGGDSDTWFVIVTRGHRYDAECLEIIVEKQNAYIGMMGSKRRVAIVKDQLEKKRYRQRRFRAGTHADRIEDQGRDSGGDRRFDHGGNNRSKKQQRKKRADIQKELSEKLFEKKKMIQKRKF